MFGKGLAAYLDGDWPKAKTFFEEGIEVLDTEFKKDRTHIKVQDGPSLCLLAFMKEPNFKAPTDWQRFRPLPG